MTGPRVALVHEWLAERAGSEMVVEELLACYPGAPLHALVYQAERYRASPIGATRVHTSFFQRRRILRRRFRGFLPLMPLAVEQYDLRGAEVVLSSHHAVAKGVLTRADQLHLSYVHSPLRYGWDLTHEYLERGGLTRGLKGLFARAALHYLRAWDHAAAARVDGFLANSRTVARRIEKTYRRPARVVYPPVHVERLRADRSRAGFYCTVSRLAPYKRIDVLVEACTRLKRELVVIGDGPELARIRTLAGPSVRLLGYQDDATVRDHLERCRAFLFAAEEDFGIVPVEAMAAGAPVLAYGRGGAAETVVDGETGRLVAEQTPAAFAAAIEAFERDGAPSAAACRARAERFGAERFRREITGVVDACWTALRERGPLAVDEVIAGG